MSVRVDIHVSDVDVVLASFTKTLVERSATQSGAFTQIASVALEAGKSDYAYLDAAGSATDWYRTRYSNANGSALSGYSAVVEGETLANAVFTADVRALVESPLGDADLERVIARAEARLAAEIGPLTGERTEVFTIVSGDAYRSLRLRRTTNAVTLTTNGDASADFRVSSDSRTVIPLSADAWALGYWTGVVEITYTPNDIDLVTSAVIDMVRATVTSPGDFQSETIGDYSYTRGTGRQTTQGIARRHGLLAPVIPTSIRIAAAWPRRSWVGSVRP